MGKIIIYRKNGDSLEYDVTRPESVLFLYEVSLESRKNVLEFVTIESKKVSIPLTSIDRLETE